jgi:hypothetical protein
VTTADSAEVPGSRFQLIDDLEIETLPSLEWLIDGVLSKGGSAVLFGDSGTGKTFVALDWAFSIALGQPWFGRVVRHGPVVYVAGEGRSGYCARVLAWKREHNYVGLAGVNFLTEAVQLLEEHNVTDLISVIRALAPVLVIFDTLARCMVGGDEDRAKDMGRFIAATDRIRREIGCAVLTIHHPTKDSGHERGSGSLRGAIDTLIRLKGTPNQLILSCEKQRDGKPFDDIQLALRPVVVAAGIDSCVLDLSTPESGAVHVLDLRHRKRALMILVQSRELLRLSDWRQRTNVDLKPVVSDRDFQRIANELLEANYVAQPKGRKGPYQATEDGIAVCEVDGLIGAPSANCQPTAT